ncbi:GATOR2 complex protein WDR59 isoform X1 [Danio rerio]|uniref:GATOR2 complex protein WDR59 isoform X1 n=1 Tax=Danio rerio TaxID=7955 RepID=A0A286YB35_DANRE|nr:WD repeat-containing protein 59 isoform X1 [Danio rerio]|eukprot:XP_009291658.1 WD repeat-containing protein 59 isoform X1 [Danio rerio]
MAARWSSENVVVEFRDAQANAMSVDCLGQHAVLSGRRFLYVVNLETPSEAPRKISRQSKWDVGTVQWNPHKSDAHIFAASSNQRVDLYTWRDGSGKSHTSLQGHTRVISDLDWSWFEPEFLVTSSVDTYIYIWDTSDTRRPTVTLSAVAGASQVKWNRRNHYCLASSHDGDVRIWDKRKSNTAVEYVAAHLSKINGLDWHPDNEYILATSSQDNSVRFWDYRQPRKYLDILSCQVPVWKARYTPFSNGLVTVMVPQLRRENSLLLWSTLELNSPVHAFVGHDDVVYEFQWRPQKEGSKDCQLVTLSRDQTLRIWRVDPQLQKLCCANEIVDELTTETEKTLRSQDSEPPLSPGFTADNSLDQFDGPQSGLSSSAKNDIPQTLQQEFSLVNLQIRNVNVEMDAVNRSCFVSADCGANRVRLVVKFPAQYPNNAAPSFQFVPPTNISSSMKIKIQKILTDTSLQKVKRNQNCLEPCVRQLVSCLESDGVMEDGSNPYVLTNPVTPALPAFPRVTNTYGSYQDANIPFPRTSGARFCGTGSLVYFTRPMTMHRATPPTEPTPRSLSALSAYHSGVMTPMKMRTESQTTLRLYSGSPTRTDKDQVSISSFYYKERKPLSAARRWSVQTIHECPKSRRWKGKREGGDYSNRPIKLAGKVIIQEISCLLSVHKALGETYVLNVNDIQDTCQKNGAAALAVARRDLAKVWALASASTNLNLSPDPDPDAGTPWAKHPFGRHLLETLLEHYSQLSDVQSLAMLCSVFRGHGSPQEYFTLYGHQQPRPAVFTPHHSRYPSFTSSSVTSGSCSSTSDSANTPWNTGGRESEHPPSWGESTPDDYRYANQTYTDPREREKEQHDMNKRLLDPSNSWQFDDFKKCYGEILHRWGMKDKRAEVLKFVSCPPEPHKGIEFGVYCCHCRSQARGTQCAVCKRFTFQCSICHVAVRGSSNFCLSCGHGGHTSHMMDWFRSQDVCPTGCGCHCLQQSTF